MNAADASPLLPRPSKVGKPPPEDSNRISRLVTACLRCRLKRIKCDRQFPKCSKCAKTGSECVTVDPSTGEQISRVSMHTLEEKLKQVTAELNALKRERLLLRASPELGEPLLARTNNEFKFGKVLLMKDNEIGESSHGESASIEVPARSFVEACLQSYFTLANVQIPILHRDYFLFHYFKPLYGEIGKDLLQKLFGDKFDPQQHSEDIQLPNTLQEHQRGKCLFFLYVIIAILTSQHQQKYPLMISNHYKKQAFKFVDYVWNTDNSDDEELAKLEMMQSLLLLTQYSLMRPCSPGAWYLIGTCVRLCLDLGLHNEPMFLQSNDYYIVDMRRRLFWCCYSLDRQISVYFGRQFGIDSRQIDCPLLSTRDDLLLTYGSSAMSNMRSWITDGLDSKNVTIHFINLRVLQGEIFDYINDTANRVTKPQYRNFTDAKFDAKCKRHDHWKNGKHSELNSWFEEIPGLDDVYLLFNKMIFRLNLNQTLIQLYGQSAITPMIYDPQHHKILFEAGQEIIVTYVELVRQKLINYSWVALNNLYMGSTVYLSLISQSEEVRNLTNVQQLKLNCEGVLRVFDELCEICYEPAKDYTNKFKAHSSGVIEQFENLVAGNGSAANLSSKKVARSISESNVFSNVGDGVTPASLIAPVPKRSFSVNLNVHDETGESFLFENDVFLNNMMGSINATYEDADSDNFGDVDTLDPEYNFF